MAQVIRTFQADDPLRDVFVVGVDDDEELFHLAARFGVCLNSRVMRSRETGESRGFGFIRMATPAEATRAMQGLEGLKVRGRTLHASPVTPAHVSRISRAKERSQ
jgi:transformer-2 protein